MTVWGYQRHGCWRVAVVLSDRQGGQGGRVVAIDEAALRAGRQCRKSGTVDRGLVVGRVVSGALATVRVPR